MVTEAKIIRVVIASPGDVATERDSIPKLFNRWNKAKSKDQVQIHPEMWESGTVPEFGDHPQHAINRQIIDQGDLLVALFWQKIGSPTPTAKSGTIEEIREFIRAKGGRRVMVYFCKRHVALSPDEIDHEAIQLLKEFKNEIRNNCLYAEFDHPAELESQLYHHLDIKVAELLNGELPTPSDVNRKVDAEQWWDTDAPDSRLRLPIEFGETLEQISSGFSQRMNQFNDISGFTNDKFLNLGKHAYLSAIRSIEQYLESNGYSLPVGQRPQLEQIVSELKTLASETSLYTKRPFPKYWETGTEISKRLREIVG